MRGMGALARIAAILAAASMTIFPSNVAQTKEPARQDPAWGGKVKRQAKPQSYGFYSKGCFSGGVAIATDWSHPQAMRLSRNRRWGHPTMIKLIERLSREAVADGWPGLRSATSRNRAVGRCLAATPSPDRARRRHLVHADAGPHAQRPGARVHCTAVSMIKKGSMYVDDKLWTKSRELLLKRAASYPQVERILVNPGIKKKLCDTVTGDRSWLKKIRPFLGAMTTISTSARCQAGSSGCKSQDPPPDDEGCGKSLDWWLSTWRATRSR